jgi:hypothetical protein
MPHCLIPGNGEQRGRGNHPDHPECAHDRVEAVLARVIVAEPVPDRSCQSSRGRYSIAVAPRADLFAAWLVARRATSCRNFAACVRSFLPGKSPPPQFLPPQMAQADCHRKAGRMLFGLERPAQADLSSPRWPFVQADSRQGSKNLAGLAARRIRLHPVSRRNAPATSGDENRTNRHIIVGVGPMTGKTGDPALHRNYWSIERNKIRGRA